MLNKPLVTIVTPMYNCENYISGTVDSVLRQTYDNWELILIDDKSTDNSIEVIKKKYKAENRLKIIELVKNSGVAFARNSGLEAANGKYIAFLDSDDIWYEWKLQKQVSLLESTGKLLCYGSYDVIDENNKIIGKFEIPNEKVTYSDLLKTCYIGNLTGFYNKEILRSERFENVGHEDYVFWLNILKKIDNGIGIKEPLGQYRVHSSSISSSKLKSAKWQWKIYRQIENIGLMRSLYLFFHYAYNGFMKYKKN